MFRLKTAADRIANRTGMIPKGAHCVTNTKDAAVYVYRQLGRVGLLCFRGAAGRPEIHYLYRQMDEAKAINQATVEAAHFLIGVRESQARKSKRAAERAAWVNPLKGGELLVSSWGYDQTNVDFYAVTRVSGKRVWIRRIASDGEATGPMQERVWPRVPVVFTGDETMHIAQPCGEAGVSIKVGHHYARLAEPRTYHSSSYA